jgi:outer membrane protein assembly factor BamD
MRKIKILTLVFSVVILFNSCGEFQRTIGKGTMEERYKLAVKLYEAKEYNKALRLFEIVTPHYRGKPQMERIQFMVAQSNFNTRSYTLSGYYFDRFTKNYPKSSKKEEAAFLSAYSYKLASPRFSLDQTDTNKAMTSFQQFINDYPNSDRIEEANNHYKELRYKLEKKRFEIGKTYYRTAVTDFRNYKAAIVTFDNLISDYLGTRLKEEALYYRFKAYHDLVMVSTARKKSDRIDEAIAAYDKLVRNYPESKFLAESDKMLSTIKEEQKKLVKS